MALLALRKFSTTVYKDNSVGDDRQIPAEGANITAYYQGITVAANATVDPVTPTSVQVRDVAKFAVGDLVGIGTEAASMTVTEITDATHLKLKATGAGSVALVTGNRLIITSRTPQLYSESSGNVTTTNPKTTDERGYVEFYTREFLFDWKVSGTGLTTILYQNGESGYPPRNFYDVNEFPSVQAAFDFLPQGSRIYFPAQKGPYKPPSNAGWIVTKAFEIFGDSEHGTLEGNGFMPFSTHKDACIITFKRDPAVYSSGNRIYIHDLSFTTPLGFASEHDGVGDLIRLDNSDMDPSTIMGNIRIERCFFGYAGRSAIRTLGKNYIVGVDITDCQVYGANGDCAVKLHNITFCRLNRLAMQNYWATGLWVNCGNGSWLQVDPEGDRGGKTDIESQAALVMFECFDTFVQGGNFEQFGTFSNPGVGILMAGCQGCTVVANELDTNAPPPAAWDANATGAIGIYMKTSTGMPDAQHLLSRANFIGPNMGYGAEFGIKIKDEGANTSRDCVIMPQNAVFASATAAWKVEVPELSSNFVFVVNQNSGPDKLVGVVIPAQNNVANVAASVKRKGLVVYDSNDNILKVWNGTVWKDCYA